MINIIVNSDGLVFEGAKKINTPLNSVILLLEKASDIVMFKSSIDYDTIIQEKWQNITINGEHVTKENIVDKFNEIANTPQGGGTKINAGTNITLQPQEDGSITISATGELGGTVAWADVTDKPETFTPSAHTHLSADITDLQGKLDAKQDTLVSGTNIKTINGESILGNGDIVIEGGTGDVTKQYVDEQLALKVDKTAYEADKATFALKTEIPSIEGLASKEELQNGLEGKQDKGDYALKSELSGKQDTLVSGTNIKTINGQTLLGEGNIEIQGGGSGISDAPSDDKLYGRKNANWTEIVIPSTDNLATKEELNAKANLDGANFTGGVVVPDLSINNSTKGVMFNVSNQSNDILFRTLNAGIDSVSFQVQNAYPLKLTEAGIMENNQLLENKYAKIDDIPTKVSDLENDSGFITNTEASEKYQPIGSYLTEVPAEYVTETELSEKGYLTSIPEEYVTETELSGKGYATTSQLDGKLSVETYNSEKATFATKEELAGKANTSDLSNYLQTSVAESTYAKKSEIPEEYTLPIATAEALGGIKVGAGLSINPATGVLSATGGGTADSVDWANITSKPSTFTPSAHTHLSADITDLQGKLDAKADKTAIADMATKTWVGEQGYLTAVPAEYVTETELSGKGYLTAIPEEYVTNEELTSALSSKQDKGNYITVETADGKYQVKGDYATTAQLANKVDVSAYTEDKATFALKSELTNLATKAELNLKANTSDLSNYLQTSVAESTYAKKSEIPSLEGYLQASVADEKYATKTELEGKVDDADIADMATQTWVTSQGYLTSVPAEYVTETELNAKGYKKIEYLTQSQYDELPTKEEGVLYVITDAPEVVIPDTSDMLTKTEAASAYQPKGDYALKSELSGKQDTLVSGESIKTINGQTLLGSGDITIEGGGSSQVVWDLQTNSGNTEYITNFYNDVKVGDVVKYNNVYENNLIITISKTDGCVNCVLSPRIDSGSYMPNMNKESIWIQAKPSGTLSEGYFFPFDIVTAYNTIEVKQSLGSIQLDVSEDLRTKINDSLSKTEASETYQLKGEYATTSQLSGKQDTLVSGESIKTINGQTLLGSGDITIEAGTSGNDVQEVADITNVSIADVIENRIYIDTNTIEDFSETYAAEGPAPIYSGNIYIGNGKKLLKVYDKDTLTKTEASTTYKTIASEWYGTQSQYDGIAEKDPNVTYYITEG